MSAILMFPFSLTFGFSIPFDHLLLSARVEDLQSPLCLTALTQAATQHCDISYLHSPSTPGTHSIYLSRVFHLLVYHLVFWRQKGDVKASKAILTVKANLLEALKTADAFPVIKTLIFTGLPALDQLMSGDGALGLAEGLSASISSILSYRSLRLYSCDAYPEGLP